MELNGKVLLITGGTGSFGNAVLDRYLDTPIKEIRIFSRDEKKQDDMRHKLLATEPGLVEKLKFYIGDTRDKASVENVMPGVDYVFHAAALKQVPSCEFFPLEAVKTNILGTENVLNAAIASQVKKVICLSTDKAAYPINAMGISKAMMEKVAIGKSRTADPAQTTICVTRYGNVLCSRGSVVPLFMKQIRAKQPITVTDPHMTRFIMSLAEAVSLVGFAFDNALSGDLLVQKAPACTIEVLAQAVCKIFNVSCNMKVIGIRHGEKRYETLLTKEEHVRAQDIGNYFRASVDARDLNYDNYIDSGVYEPTAFAEFNSNNTEQLNVDQVVEKLLELPEVQGALLGKKII